MDTHWQIRTQMLYPDEALESLAHAHAAVLGLGGVGGYAAEALCRSGVGTLTLLDCDRFSESNINRQLGALHSTVGQYKTEVMAARLADINPQCRIVPMNFRYDAQSGYIFWKNSYDYVVDAIDLVACKLDLIEQAHKRGVPILSALGTGNKTDPTRFRICDIAKTRDCPLARVVRKELRARGLCHTDVLWSDELPKTPRALDTPPPGRRSVPGSVPWVPGAAGFIMAGYVIERLLDPLNQSNAKPPPSSKA